MERGKTECVHCILPDLTRKRLVALPRFASGVGNVASQYIWKRCLHAASAGEHDYHIVRGLQAIERPEGGIHVNTHTHTKRYNYERKGSTTKDSMGHAKIKRRGTIRNDIYICINYEL